MRFALAIALLPFAAPAFAQTPTIDATWSYPQFRVAQTTPPLPPVPPSVAGSDYVDESERPIATGLPACRVRARDLPAQSGQQHWFSMNLGLGQPSTGRVGVKVWSRSQNSLWVEAYAGSALFNVMYGFGLRLQHTAVTFRNGDMLMVSPGVGVQILPNWDAYAHPHPFSGWGWSPSEVSRNTLCFVYGDVDISWLHDFTPHFGFELGMKLGVAGLAGGNVGKYYPRSLMIGPEAYPFVAVYSGFRF